MTAVLVTVSEVPSKEAKGGTGCFGDVVGVCVCECVPPEG